jgi:hypothetical protein
MSRDLGKSGLMIVASALALAIGLLGASSARADSIFQGYDGATLATSHLAGQVDFNLTGSVLKITVTNISMQAALSANASADTLTAVTWNDSTSIGGTFTDVEMGAGSIIIPTSGYTAGDEGLFGYSTSAGINGGTYGVSSYGVFMNFDGQLTLGGVPNLTNANSPDGPPGGLIPAANGTNSYAPNGNQLPVIENALVYTISGVSITSLSGINGVVFQYGTGTSEPSFSGSPVPVGAPPLPLPSAAWAGLGLLGLVALQRRYRMRRSD